MNKVINLKILLAFFLIVFCIQYSAIAQQNKIATLQTEVEKLQQKVSQLESKVQQLEKLFLSKKNNGASLRDNDNSGDWKNKQNWRRLKNGMSKEEAKQILGEPDRIEAHGPLEFWRYPNGGRVSFFDEEINGWSEPLD